MNKQSKVMTTNIPDKAQSSKSSNSSDVTRIKLGDGNYVDLTVDVDSELEELLDEDEDLEDEEQDEEFNAIVEQAESAWTNEELEEMMYILKERGMITWIEKYIVERKIPIQKLLYAFNVVLSKDLRSRSDSQLFSLLKLTLVRTLRDRERLSQYNTIEDVLTLLRNSQKIIILTGAGISVSCGIPDFRSRNGLYAMLQESGQYELDDPQQMFDITYFRENPSVFYSFAYRIYPSNFTPSACHRFIKVVEDRGKLLRNYTQNIDTLERSAGINRVLQCHGSFATAVCIECRQMVPGTDIEKELLSKTIPYCKKCSGPASKKSTKKKKKKKESGWGANDTDDDDTIWTPNGLMKPSITFFGEKLVDEFDRSLFADRDVADLLLIMGTSLKVMPVAEILTHLPHSVPQIVINKTPIRHVKPDIQLLGDADTIVRYLSTKLGWDLDGTASDPSKKRPPPSVTDLKEPQRVGNSHIWLFEGAELGNFAESLELENQPNGVDRAASSLSVPKREGSDDSRSSKRSRTQ